MYKVIKDKGRGANISIENTDTRANVIIGKTADTAIISILEKQGYEFDKKIKSDTSDKISYHEEWNLAVNKEAAEELVHLALSIKKPIRDQRKKSTTTKEIEINKNTDAFDLIYGI